MLVKLECSAAPFTEQNWKRGPCPTRCMQEQVAIGSMKNVFHTGNLIKTVQNCVRTCKYHKYSSTTGNNSTLVSKIVCMHTYWKLFSMNSEVREARTLPGVTFCSVNGVALLRFFFFSRYPGLLVICFLKEKKKRLHQTLVPKYAQEAL